MKKILLSLLAVILFIILAIVIHFVYSIYNIQNQTDLFTSQISKGSTEEHLSRMINRTYLTESEVNNADINSTLRKQYDDIENNGIGNEIQFEQRIISTLNDLLPFLSDESLVDDLIVFFRSAQHEFNKERDLKKLNLVNKTINSWVKDNLSYSAKIKSIKFFLASYLNIQSEDTVKSMPSIMEILDADINSVEKDPTMAPEAFEQMVHQSMTKINSLELKPKDSQNNTSIFLVAKTYHSLSQALQTDITTPYLVSWYKEQTKYTPPDFDQLSNNAYKYLMFMKEAELIDEQERAKISTILNNDIALFKKESDKKILKNAATKSLKTIEEMAGDTEDREFFTGFYYDLALNKGINIGSALEQWMYGFSEEKEKDTDKLPWSR